MMDFEKYDAQQVENIVMTAMHIHGRRVNSTTGFSPMQVVLASKPLLESEGEVNLENVALLDNLELLSQAHNSVVLAHSRIRKDAAENRFREVLSRSAGDNKKRVKFNEIYQSGDYIMVKKAKGAGIRKKWTKEWIGPFLVELLLIML